MHAVPEPLLLRQAGDLLQQTGAEDKTLLRILDLALAHFQCPVGTIHIVDEKSGMLTLRVHRGLPEVVIEKVRLVPVGKGMAGLAAERKQPVQVCNLQTDTSGDVRPGAKSTQMEGSVAVPLLLENGSVRGVLGVAKPVTYEFTAEEIGLLLNLGTLLARHSGRPSRNETLDQYFMDARSKLIDLAAFLDRVDRADGSDDFRLRAFKNALQELNSNVPGRTRRVLLAFSDPTTEPIAEAPGKSACGAWPGAQ